MDTITGTRGGHVYGKQGWTLLRETGVDTFTGNRGGHFYGKPQHAEQNTFTGNRGGHFYGNQGWTLLREPGLAGFINVEMFYIYVRDLKLKR